MKKIITISLFVLLSCSTVYADIKAGQKTYLKMFKTSFGLNGTLFAAGHSTEEWNVLFADGAKGFIVEYSEKYPKAKAVLENPANAKKIQDVGDFAKEYSNDSGNVPSCG